ncbi:uncharacterized protein LY79DRAFT_389344 [Colletotrichum navitas]|uniref:Uncharacterized protein n=1 Tax=Colletotrichum navitas TaxID=681940 RepID=A0AAD8V0A7_9PEZI|nr:uncharacterized protein LY79DRAFT_389344 [Colletotrichum navitas]KAK1574108.1 hypothetical protein LY79DRAFT_389344 [Colletotrichum navitas]
MRWLGTTAHSTRVPMPNPAGSTALAAAPRGLPCLRLPYTTYNHLQLSAGPGSPPGAAPLFANHRPGGNHVSEPTAAPFLAVLARRPGAPRHVGLRVLCIVHVDPSTTYHLSTCTVLKARRMDPSLSHAYATLSNVVRFVYPFLPDTRHPIDHSSKGTELPGIFLHHYSHVQKLLGVCNDNPPPPGEDGQGKPPSIRAFDELTCRGSISLHVFASQTIRCRGPDPYTSYGI